MDVSFSCICPVIDNEFRHSCRVDPQTTLTIVLVTHTLGLGPSGG